jgi:hypothetical protein
MNATEAIDKIKTLLGFNLVSESFATTKLMDGETEVTTNKEGDLSVGDTLYVVKETTLVPAPAGEHITREGLVITLDNESTIVKIESKEDMEDEEVEKTEVEIEDEKTDMMSSAVLTDGTKVETDEDGPFAVGQKLYVITQEGEKVSAPEGEHTTQSGIVLVVDGEGVLTGVKYPDESGEGSLEDMKKDMEKMKESMSKLLGIVDQINGKFKVEINTLKTELQEFKNQPDRKPVVKQFKSSTDLLDWKVELLKNSKR